MEKLADEIFNILKGANYKLRMFTMDGASTLDSEEATRFYAYDQDLMVSVRQDDAKIEVVVQAGADYDVPGNSELLKAIKTVAHNNLGEFTVRKFNKSITPKDFAHQSVTESKAFGKAYGSIKTSYIPAPNKTKVVVKHSNKVDEEKRGARSRNIHSIFIENSHGEKFKFPYSNIQGAKAMAKHVSENGTPYDTKGQAILAMCEDLSNISAFVKHVRGNGLVNEGNEDVVETVREAANSIKNKIKSLSTNKGYNNFDPQGEKESISEVDLSEKFMYNALEAEDISKAVSTVSRIIAERNGMDSTIEAGLDKLEAMNGDFGFTIDKNDPDHPANSGMTFGDDMAKVSAFLSYFGAKSMHDMETSNVFDMLSGAMNDMNKKQLVRTVQLVTKILKGSGPAKTTENSVGLAESALLGLRSKIA